MLLNCFFYIVSAKGKIHKKENDNKKYLPALRLYLCDRTGAIWRGSLWFVPSMPEAF